MTAAPKGIEHAHYPSTDVHEQLRFLIQYAILAPSSHNTQPWKFRVADDRIEVWADPTRLLPTIDPDRRQLFMSCGAALMNLRLAMRRFGYNDQVVYLPDEKRPDLVAIVTRDVVASPTQRELDLFEAIPLRRTNRDPFENTPIGEDLASEIMAEAAEEQAWMVRLNPLHKADVALAIAEADRRQYHDPKYRAELSRWLAPLGSTRHDGIPIAKKDVITTLPILAPLAIRAIDRGEAVAAHEAALATQAPMLAVLGTELDDPLAWLWAGEALEAAFLRATRNGVAMSFLNQVVEDAEMRDVIKSATGHPGYPQLVLRFGYGPPQTATPRRPVAEVLEP